MLDSDPDGSQGAATVNLDIKDGVRQVTDHLLALGHRRFLHLAADIPSWTFEVRARELAARLAEAPGTDLRTARAPISFEDALAAAHTALSDPAGPRPTAVICDDDKLAAGAYKAARRLGLRIPDDISVTGLGDLALAQALDPELTTVRLDAELFGEQGMKALLAVLDGRTPPRRTSRSTSSYGAPRPRHAPPRHRPGRDGGPRQHERGRPGVHRNDPSPQAPAGTSLLVVGVLRLGRGLRSPASRRRAS